jgi:hypothetical protein
MKIGINIMPFEVSSHLRPSTIQTWLFYILMSWKLHQSDLSLAIHRMAQKSVNLRHFLVRQGKVVPVLYYLSVMMKTYGGMEV